MSPSVRGWVLVIMLLAVGGVVAAWRTFAQPAPAEGGVPPMPPEGGMAMPGPGPMEGGDVGLGAMSRYPEMAELVRDIMVLRTLNSLHLQPAEMESLRTVLLRLKNREATQRAAVKNLLMAQRAQLIQGEESPEQMDQARAQMRGQMQQFRGSMEAAQQEIEQLLGPERAQAFKRLLSPPARRLAPGPPSSTRPDAGQPWRRNIGGPSYFSSIEVKRVLRLLDEMREARIS